MEDRGGGGGGSGEVRRIRVVYFLSRNGRTEQPHLMRVHYRQRNGGVRLRDVKRWLSELRGKYIPESHAWSYKRRYKSGYVWQDLTDDDLITPNDDNEYVLMGSFVPTISVDDENNGKTNAATGECDGKSNPNPNNPPPSAVAKEDVAVDKSAPSSSSSSSSKSRQLPDYDDAEKEECPRRRFTTYVDVSTQTPALGSHTIFDLHRHDVTTSEKASQEEEGDEPVRQKRNMSKPSMSLGNSRKGAGGEKGIASSMFRNLITCGGSETRDSAMIPIDRPRMDGGAEEEKEEAVKNQHRNSPSPPAPENRRELGKNPNKNKNKNKNKHTVTFPEPLCPQCGKPFNPEKLFSHLKKSCEWTRRMRKRSKRQDSYPMGLEEAKNFALFSFILSHS